MSLNSTFKVFCFLHALEATGSLILVFFHSFVFDDPDEPTQQQPFFLVFLVTHFLILSICVLLIIKQRINMKADAAIASFGFITFVFLSLKSMYDVERDAHLTIIPDTLEALHYYFKQNFIQSVACLTVAWVFLMHFTFVFDYIANLPSDDSSIVSTSTQEIEIDIDKPLRLYFFPEDFVKYLKSKFVKSNSSRKQQSNEKTEVETEKMNLEQHSLKTTSDYSI